MGRGSSAGANEESSQLLYGPRPGRKRARDEDTPTVLIIRDPDYENEYVVDGDIDIIDIDIGASFEDIEDIVDELGEEEARDWCEHVLGEVAHLPADHEGRQVAESIVAQSGLTDLKPAPQDGTPASDALVVVREPDSGTEAYGPAEIINVDLGAEFNGPKYFSSLSAERQAEYLAEQREKVADFPKDSPIRQRVEEQMAQLADDAD